MTIPRYEPHMIHLGGPAVEINDYEASEAITPGMLVELFTSGGVTRFRKSTLTGAQSVHVMRNMSMQNVGIDDACAAGDLIEVLACQPGTTVYGLIASGANIAAGDPLSDAGNGYFKAASGVTIARAIQTVDNSAGPSTARIRVEFV